LDTAKYLWEQLKVTRCGSRKRKRREDDSVDEDDEAKEGKGQKKLKNNDAEGKGLTKDQRVEKGW